MRALVSGLVLSFLLSILLVGCGGGGGSKTWPTTPIGINDLAIGSLSAASVTAPDGTYVNFYTVDIATTVDLSISLTSVEFDTYLLLFDGAALGEANLNNWGAYWIAENDDVNPGDTNSFLLQTLPPGTYVIAVNSFAPATGAYTLTTSAPVLSLSRQYVQFRTFETPANDRYVAWVDCKDNGALLAPGDLLTARLYDPLGAEVVPAGLTFTATPYTVASWVPASNQFGSIATDGDSAFLFDLSNQAALASGVYTFEVDPAAGGTLTTTFTFPGRTDLVPVAAASMTSQWNGDGSLTLGWSAPVDTFDQYRVVLTFGGNGIFFGRVLPGVTSVTLQKTLIDQITALSSVPSAATVNWTMQTRNYVGDGNYARSISDPVALTWP